MNTETTQLEAEYETLRVGLLEVHQPRDAHQRVLVEEFIDACWDWKAARRVDREFWCHVGTHYEGGESGIAAAQFQEKETRFRTHLRYRADCERSYYRALGALKNLSRDTRLSSAITQHAPAPPPPASAPDSFAASTSPLVPADRLSAPDNIHQSLLILRHCWIAVLAWIALHLQTQRPTPVPAASRRAAALFVAGQPDVAVRRFPHRDPCVRVLPFRRRAFGPGAPPGEAGCPVAA